MWQILFEGFNELPSGQFLAIDDVSFSKEPCKQIPPKQDGGKVEIRPFFNEWVPQ